MPLWAQHLVVDYPAAEQFVHPYRVLLAVIQIVYPQPLEVEVGEFLVRPVVLRAHVTVESTVIEVCQAVFEVGRLLAQPFGLLRSRRDDRQDGRKDPDGRSEHLRNAHRVLPDAAVKVHALLGARDILFRDVCRNGEVGGALGAHGGEMRSGSSLRNK